MYKSYIKQGNKLSNANRSIPGARGGQHWLARFIDHRESYGPHIMQAFMSKINPFQTVVDIGAGGGRDLSIAMSVCPDAKTIAIEASNEYAKNLSGTVDEVEVINLEKR